MTETILISESTIKSYTAVNDNVDSKLVYTTIRQIQDIDLDTIIGPALNNKLQELVRTGDIQLPKYVDYKDLLDNWITPYMCAKVQAEIQVYINYKLVNSGVIQNEDERRSHIGFSEGRSLIEQYNNIANAYGSKLKNHLCCNCNKYPEYHQVIDHQGEEEQPLCSIYLGDRRDKYSYIGK